MASFIPVHVHVLQYYYIITILYPRYTCIILVRTRVLHVYRSVPVAAIYVFQYCNARVQGVFPCVQQFSCTGTRTYSSTRVPVHTCVAIFQYVRTCGVRTHDKHYVYGTCTYTCSTATRNIEHASIPVPVLEYTRTPVSWQQQCKIVTKKSETSLCRR